MTPVKLTHYKKKEIAEDCKAKKAAKVTTKQSVKTKAIKPLPEVGGRLTRNQLTVSTDLTVILN